VFCIFCPALVIQGQCEFVKSTDRSLTFIWTAAKSASTYRLVGHARSESTGTNGITVGSLTPGSYYTFTVLAVGSHETASNNITCVNSTGALRVFFSLLSMTQFRLHRPMCLHSGTKSPSPQLCCSYTVSWKNFTKVIVHLFNTSEKCHHFVSS